MRRNKPTTFTSTTVRFWVWHEGSYTRLTLRADKPVTHHSGGPTEEGWEYYSETYLLTGDTVTVEYGVTALDCDGRMDSARSFECPVWDLAALPQPRQEFSTPIWTDAEACQRDYEAERAGY